MPVVLSATWVARPGEEGLVTEALRNLIPASRAEPGNLCYQAYRDPAEPRTFRIFEVYVDDEAMRAHASYPHFVEWGLGRAIPALSERSREIFETIDA